MSSDQDTRGFLPPCAATGFTDELHLKPPSPTTTPTENTLHHLSGFTALPLPQPSPTSTTTTSGLSYSSGESQLATAIGRAIYNIRDAVAAATAGDTHNPIRRTKSDITHQYPRPTTTARRNPLRRTVSDTTILPPPPPPPPGSRTVPPSPNSRNVVSESLNRKESPQIKRLRKLQEKITNIEQMYWEFRREFEFESESEVAVQENVEDDEPTEVIAGEDEARDKHVEFERLDEGQEECVGFKQLEDGGLRIQMRCSCCKRFEILHNQIGCFYRLI